ncbi:MAG: HD domain-containing protein [Candidatus Hydrogenedentes bacterium]|nr:HD domain-containing protein [Candidatus Hydrogenedentota bacterium]
MSVANPIRGFREVPLASIRVDSITEFDIHIQTRRDRPPILFRERSLPVTPAVLGMLVDQRHHHIYIPAAQTFEYRRYVGKHIEAILSDRRLPVDAKCEVLYDSAQGLMADILEQPRSKELVQCGQNVVAGTVRFMMQERAALSYLLQLVSYDYYTYTHCVNVCVFSLALAQRSGITDFDTLRLLGEGALLHDVGKSLIDPSVTKCKKGLTEEQWEIMRKHPVYGYQLLTEHGMLHGASLDIVRHHHEKVNGTGYPDGLRGKTIEPLVRISTIADVFDALTTRRTYRDAMASFHALSLMKSEMSRQLDQELLRTFIEMMGNPAK